MGPSGVPMNPKTTLFFNGGPENGGWKGVVFDHNGIVWVQLGELTNVFLGRKDDIEDLIGTARKVVQQEIEKLQELSVIIDMAQVLCPNDSARSCLDQANREILAASYYEAQRHLLKALLTDTNFVLPTANQTLTVCFETHSIQFFVPGKIFRHHYNSIDSGTWISSDPIREMIKRSYIMYDLYPTDYTFNCTLQSETQNEAVLRLFGRP